MRYFQSIEDILNFAITLEEVSCDLAYRILERMADDDNKAIISQYQKDEQEHIKTLKSFKKPFFTISLQKALGLKIADYMVLSETPNYNEMKYKDILSFAIKNESACMKLYTHLSKLSTKENIAIQLADLAQQEAHHRHILQREYDNKVRNS